MKNELDVLCFCVDAFTVKYGILYYHGCLLYLLMMSELLKRKVSVQRRDINTHLLVKMCVLLKSWWRSSRSAPSRVGHNLTCHVQAHHFQIVFNGPFFSHGILLNRCQNAFVVKHIPGRFWIS